ncbi:MAG: hypothetical protein ACQKBW_11915 [Puniceicoccales bacterium]
MSSQRRALSRGCGASTPKTRRERDHLDGRKKANKEDNAKANVRRRQEALEASFDAGDFLSPLGLSYPDLDRGTSFAKDGRELSEDDRDGILDLLQRQRSWYWSRYYRKNGTLREKEESHKGEFKVLHQLLITVNPPYSMAYMELDKLDPDRLIRYLKSLAVRLMNEFERVTDLEAVLIDVHAAEGNLHFHLEYVTVDEDNEILWPKIGRGFRKLKRLGIPTTNFLRQVESGFVDKKEAKKAYGYLRKRTKDNNGAMPVDYLLAMSLDAACERFFEREPDLAPILEDAWTKYQQFVDQKRAKLPEKLDEQNKILSDQLREMKSIAEYKHNEALLERDKRLKLEAESAALKQAREESEQKLAEVQLRRSPPSVPKDRNIQERLRGYIPDAILDDCLSVQEITVELFTYRTPAARKLLHGLAHDGSLPLEEKEIEAAKATLSIWDEDVLGLDKDTHVK